MKVLKKKLSKFGKLLTPQEIDEFRRRPTIFVNGNIHNDYDYLNAGLLNEKNDDISYNEIKREHLLLGMSHLHYDFVRVSMFLIMDD